MTRYRPRPRRPPFLHTIAELAEFVDLRYARHDTTPDGEGDCVCGWTNPGIADWQRVTMFDRHVDTAVLEEIAERLPSQTTNNDNTTWSWPDLAKSLAAELDYRDLEAPHRRVYTATSHPVGTRTRQIHLHGFDVLAVDITDDVEKLLRAALADGDGNPKAAIHVTWYPQGNVTVYRHQGHDDT